jgi:hypothetical protein
MIHKAKDLSPDQKMAIESLLGRAVAEDEAISIRTLKSVSAPEWLQQSWESAKRLGLDQLSTEEIDAEIDAARKARRNRQDDSAPRTTRLFPVGRRVLRRNPAMNEELDQLLKNLKLRRMTRCECVLPMATGQVVPNIGASLNVLRFVWLEP